MKIKHLLNKLQINLSHKPHSGMKVYTLEGADPDEALKSLYESQIHPSVLEENLHHSHPHPHFDKAVFSWIAPEYIQHPKSARWWVIAAIVWLVSVILEAFTGNWSMLLATVTFGLVYWYIHEHHPPRHTKINLSELGVKIGHRSIHYAEIDAFWIIYKPHTRLKRLCFRLHDKFIPDLILELEDQDPQPIRVFLEHHLPEIVGVQEHFGDIILRLFRI